MEKYTVTTDKYNNYIIREVDKDFENPLTWESAVSLLKNLAEKRKKILQEYT